MTWMPLLLSIPSDNCSQWFLWVEQHICYLWDKEQKEDYACFKDLDNHCLKGRLKNCKNNTLLLSKKMTLGSYETLALLRSPAHKSTRSLANLAIEARLWTKFLLKILILSVYILLMIHSAQYWERRDHQRRSEISVFQYMRDCKSEGVIRSMWWRW